MDSAEFFAGDVSADLSGMINAHGFLVRVRLGVLATDVAVRPEDAYPSGSAATAKWNLSANVSRARRSSARIARRSFNDDANGGCTVALTQPRVSVFGSALID